MKRSKIKGTSIPALVIGLVIVAGLVAYVYSGASKNRIRLSSGNSSFLPQAAQAVPSPMGVQVAAQGAGSLSGASVTAWIKPAIAVLFTTQTRMESGGQMPMRAGNQAQYAMPNTTQVTHKLGTGVIVHPSGYILTNNHLTDRADNLLVGLQGFREPLKARVIDVDPKSDLSLIKVDVNYPLPVVSFHKANHIMQGERLIAVTVNPDMSGKARRATVSALRSSLMLDGAIHADLISLDKSLGASFTGAPVVDANGFVAGLALPVNHARDGNKAYVISTKTIRRFLSRTIERTEMPVLVNRTTPSFGTPQSQAIPVGLVREAPLRIASNNQYWLGVNFQNLEPTQAKLYNSPFPKGAMVNFIHPDGPAVSSGLQTGDIILKANGRLVRGADDISAVVRRAKDKSVTLQIFRKGERTEITIPTRPNPVAAAQNRGTAVASMNVAQINGMPAAPAAPRVDMDRMFANQKKRLLIERAGLDPSIMNMRLDGDQLTRMARERLVAIKLGIDPALMGRNGKNVIRNTLWRELAPKLGVDATLVSLPGMGRGKIAEAAGNIILSEALGISREIASSPGVTRDEIVQMAIDNYLASRMGIPARELNNIKIPPSAATARTAVAPGGQGQPAQNNDRIMRKRRMETIVSNLDLDQNLLSIPGMSIDRLLKIAGDRYLLDKLGGNPALLTLPGFDRELIIRGAINRGVVAKLGLDPQLARNRQASAEQIIKIAENRLLAQKLGLPLSMAVAEGTGQGRLIRIAGERELARLLKRVN